MSQEAVDKVLEHHGIKGMKWGVRKAVDIAIGTKTAGRKPLRKETNAQKMLRIGNTAQARKDARKDAKWLKKQHGVDVSKGQWQSKSTKEILKTVNKTIKPEMKAINQKPEYSGRAAKKQLKDFNSKLYAKHEKEHTDLYVKHLKAAAEKHHQVSPSGKWEENLHVSKDGSWWIGIKKTGAMQQDNLSDMLDMDVVVHVRPIRDENGLIVDYESVDDSLAQSAIDSVLEHHGVLGMKWGVRRKATVGPQEVILRDSRVPGSKRLVTKGGSGHPTSSDAAKARTIGQIGKKSGYKALSNEELQTYTRRLQLEQSARRLNYEDSSPPKKFVMDLLGRSGKGAAQQAANEVATQQVKKHLIKAGMLAAAA